MTVHRNHRTRPNTGTTTKYGNKRVEHAGMWFDSQGELARWLSLKERETAGEITGLERQLSLPLIISGEPVRIRSGGFPNGRACRYRADFRYVVVATGEEIIEDFKGFDDEASRLRRAVVEAIYRCRIEIVKG